MAKKTVAKYFSDLSGAEILGNSPTVRFSVGGNAYEIDLTDSEQQAFQAALQLYVDAGRRARPGRQRVSGPQPADVRTWAESQGLTVPKRGRIPGSVLEAYAAAH